MIETWKPEACHELWLLIALWEGGQDLSCHVHLLDNVQELVPSAYVSQPEMELDHAHFGLNVM